MFVVQRELNPHFDRIVKIIGMIGYQVKITFRRVKKMSGKETVS